MPITKFYCFVNCSVNEMGDKRSAVDYFKNEPKGLFGVLPSEEGFLKGI